MPTGPASYDGLPVVVAAPRREHGPNSEVHYAAPEAHVSKDPIRWKSRENWTTAVVASCTRFVPHLPAYGRAASVCCRKRQGRGHSKGAGGLTGAEDGSQVTGRTTQCCNLFSCCQARQGSRSRHALCVDFLAVRYLPAFGIPQADCLRGTQHLLETETLWSVKNVRVSLPCASWGGASAMYRDV